MGVDSNDPMDEKIRGGRLRVDGFDVPVLTDPAIGRETVAVIDGDFIIVFEPQGATSNHDDIRRVAKAWRASVDEMIKAGQWPFDNRIAITGPQARPMSRVDYHININPDATIDMDALNAQLAKAQQTILHRRKRDAYSRVLGLPVDGPREDDGRLVDLSDSGFEAWPDDAQLAARKAARKAAARLKENAEYQEYIRDINTFNGAMAAFAKSVDEIKAALRDALAKSWPAKVWQRVRRFWETGE